MSQCQTKMPQKNRENGANNVTQNLPSTSYGNYQKKCSFCNASVVAKIVVNGKNCFKKKRLSLDMWNYVLTNFMKKGVQTLLDKHFVVTQWFGTYSYLVTTYQWTWTLQTKCNKYYVLNRGTNSSHVMKSQRSCRVVKMISLVLRNVLEVLSISCQWV